MTPPLAQLFPMGLSKFREGRVAEDVRERRCVAFAAKRHRGRIRATTVDAYDVNMTPGYSMLPQKVQTRARMRRFIRNVCGFRIEGAFDGTAPRALDEFERTNAMAVMERCFTGDAVICVLRTLPRASVWARALVFSLKLFSNNAALVDRYRRVSSAAAL